MKRVSRKELLVINRIIVVVESSIDREQKESIMADLEIKTAPIEEPATIEFSDAADDLQVQQELADREAKAQSSPKLDVSALSPKPRSASKSRPMHQRSSSRGVVHNASKTPSAASVPKRHSIMSTVSAERGTPSAAHPGQLISKEERIRFLDNLTSHSNLGATMAKTLKEVVNADIPVELLTPLEDSPILDAGAPQTGNHASAGLHSQVSAPSQTGSSSTATISASPSYVDYASKIEHMDEIVSQFNQNPERGVELLTESKLIPVEHADELASFLYSSFGVDPDALGKYIGKKDRKDLLESYVSKNDFRGMSIADAVRHMLRKFKPQGENAIIDRVVTAFATSWTRDNPDVFSHPDTAYQLAFATLMVNTSLHNPHAMERAPPLVRNVSSFQRVVKRELCREEKNLTQTYLEDLYNSIRQRPIELVADKYMTIFRDSVRSGWVEKKTQSSVTRWKRRLLVLSGHPFIGYGLYYFKAGRDRAWRMMIPLNGNVQCGTVTNDGCSFFIQRMDGDEISAAKRNDEGVTEKHDRQRFVFKCSDEREAQFWLESIQDCLTKHSEHLRPKRPQEASVGQTETAS
eukprot:TRINITY_DN240_c1_g1_i1.p1 TRINITY_DN240_c1_g1~~TRINITY_DN240_c1_g1_i1.p1  ORF type:complete len:579 (+),score=103.62 TRINITY_DN240_c1_g1_i1:1494-3230(+)